MKKLLLSVLAVAALGAQATTFTRPLDRVASMDPLRATSMYDAMAIALAYEAPLEIDYFARPYKLRPGLCALPEVSADAREYTFTIREGAVFHADPSLGNKSRPVTAQDLVYSLKRLADKKNASSGLWTMDAVARDAKGEPRVEALDARRVKITLKEPQYVFPWLMAMPYASAVPQEAVEMYGSRFGSLAVGSGPYRLTDWWRNHRMRYTRAPAWPGWKDIPTKPYDELEFVVVDDASTQWLMFLSGEVDMLRAIANDNWDAVVGPDGKLLPDLQAKGIRLFTTVALEVDYIGINMKDPVLGPNKKLRQALNCAFDFDAWNRYCNNRLLPCSGPVPPGVEGRLETPFAYSYDVEKAKKLLAEAGYPGGIDPKTNRRLVISISCGRANQEVREEIELVQSFYNAVGLKLEPRYMTWDAFLQAVNRGQTSLYLMSWLGDYPDAENFLQVFHSKNVAPGSNHGNYVNPEFDRIYDAGLTTRNAEERLTYWRKAQEIIREDCPWIFLYYPKRYSFAKARLGNYIPSDFPYGTEKYLYLKEQNSK